MKKIVQAMLILGVGAGIVGVTSTTASANSQYSAKRSKSVRLVWRKSMKRHAMTATTGARYSKHLGIRYSNNDVTPTVTWYTDAHEKLYKKNKGHNAIYYHVKSADGTLQGWIWRGYLKPVSTKKNALAAVNAQPDPKNPDWVSLKDETPVDKEILSLFPGTIEDKTLDAQAGSVVYTNDGEETPATPAGQTFIYLSNSSALMDTKNYDKLLTAAGYPAAKRAQYRGWHIGVRTQIDNEWGEGISEGDAAVYLAPAK